MARRRCAYCGTPTRVLPLQGLASSQLSRAVHSPLRAPIPPLCEAVRQGIVAMRTVG